MSRRRKYFSEGNKFQIVLVNEGGEELHSYFASFIPPENSIVSTECSDNLGSFYSRWLISSPPEIEIEKGKVHRVIFKAKAV